MNFFKLAEIEYTFVFDVKFTEKEKAKGAGLKWNPVIKKWCLRIRTNGKTETIMNELGILSFQVVDIASDAFEWKPTQKQELFELCKAQVR